MVCLYGLTYTRLRNSLTDYQLNSYPLWNWLTHRLKNFIDSKKDPLVFNKWFEQISNELKKTFSDINKERVLKCLNDSPAQEVSDIIYDATSLKLQTEFLAWLPAPLPPPPPPNPANDEIPFKNQQNDYALENKAMKQEYDDSFPPYLQDSEDNSDCNSLPDLEPLMDAYKNQLSGSV